jgi:hypothetical protein
MTHVRTIWIPPPRMGRREAAERPSADLHPSDDTELDAIGDVTNPWAADASCTSDMSRVCWRIQVACLFSTSSDERDTCVFPEIFSSLAESMRDGHASRRGHVLGGISSASTAAGRSTAPRGGKRRTRKPGKILLIIFSRRRWDPCLWMCFFAFRDY